MPQTYQTTYWQGRDTSGYRCRDCGRSRDEAHAIDVHHIDGRTAGDHPDNLTGICRRCHLQHRHERDADFLGSAFDPPQPRRGSPPAAGSLTPP